MIGEGAHPGPQRLLPKHRQPALFLQFSLVSARRIRGSVCAVSLCEARQITSSPEIFAIRPSKVEG
ncbi:hypothetical protein BDV09DRAFT_171346 [Aspergillus tetrazonus]